MNKLPLDLKPNFKDADILKTISDTLYMMENSSDPQIKIIAEKALQTILLAWYTNTNPTEH